MNDKFFQSWDTSFNSTVVSGNTTTSSSLVKGSDDHKIPTFNVVDFNSDTLNGYKYIEDAVCDFMILITTLPILVVTADGGPIVVTVRIYHMIEIVEIVYPFLRSTAIFFVGKRIALGIHVVVIFQLYHMMMRMTVVRDVVVSRWSIHDKPRWEGYRENYGVWIMGIIS